MPAVEINGLNGQTALSGVVPGSERGGENDQMCQEICCSRAEAPHPICLVCCPQWTTVNYDGCFQVSCLITWFGGIVPVVGFLIPIIYALALWEPNVRKNGSDPVIGAPMIALGGMPTMTVNVSTDAPQPVSVEVAAPAV